MIAILTSHLLSSKKSTPPYTEPPYYLPPWWDNAPLWDIKGYREPKKLQPEYRTSRPKKLQRGYSGNEKVTARARRQSPLWDIKGYRGGPKKLHPEYSAPKKVTEGLQRK